MPSIIKDYEYDIFVSYRKNDNNYDHWVSEFVSNLRLELEATVKDRLNIYFDENQVMQILHNLIRNAADSMQQGGALNMKTGRDAEWVTLSISDTGSGIPAAIMDRLFDPFFTTKPDGTGLGLAVSKKIIEDHEGAIDVQSTVGKGTTFTIRFPMTPSASLLAATQQAQAQTPQITAPLGVAPVAKAPA